MTASTTHSARKHQRGFSMLELVIVMVVIGIATALAIPRFTKSQDEARLGEADVHLQQIRSAQLRYFQDQGAFTTNTAALALQWPTGGYFTYQITSASAADFTATAIRNGQSSLAIQRNGVTYKPYTGGQG